jgi:hypothetical protein
MANDLLHGAKRAKNDEFYTQYADIEKEINAYLEYDPEVFLGKTVLLPCDDPEWSNFTKYFAQNFTKLGLKKLISTSYAPNSKPIEFFYQPTLFEIESPGFDESKTASNGKIFTLTKDKTGDKVINVEDLEWNYLKGDGDFRSVEVTNLRDEADIIITNPPFSLFTEFLAWIVGANKRFVIVGNQNAITYKDVFPLIKANKMWLGRGFTRNMAHFYTPYVTHSKWIEQEGDNIVRVAGIQWFTNLEHGRRHEPLPLMTMADNIKFSKHKAIKGVGYSTYDNFEAIEVPFTDAIPADHDGLMGVPITFLNKYNPEQFEIVGCSYDYGRPEGWPDNVDMSVSVGGKNVYKRLLIRHKKSP